MGSAMMKEATYHAKEGFLGFLVLAIPVALILVSTVFVYQSSCRIELGTVTSQEVREDGLYVFLDYEPDLFFEGEYEKLNVSSGEPVGIRWCPTFAGDRVRGVLTG